MSTQRVFPFATNNPEKQSKRTPLHDDGWDCASCGKKITDEFGNLITSYHQLPSERHADYEHYTQEEGYTGNEVTVYDINALELSLKVATRKALEEVNKHVEKYSNIITADIPIIIANSFKNFANQFDTYHYASLLDITYRHIKHRFLMSLSGYYRQDINEIKKIAAKVIVELSKECKKAIDDLASHIGKKEEFTQSYIQSNPICLDCIEEKMIYCAEDDCQFHSLDEDDFIAAKDRHGEEYYFCEEHAFKCDYCRNTYSTQQEEKINSDSDGKYCSSCYSENFNRCVSCDEEITNDYTFYSEEGDAYCRNCFEEQSDSNELDADDRRAAKRLFSNFTSFIRIPFDSNTIAKSLLPTLQLAAKKNFNDFEDLVKFVDKRLQNKELKLFVPSLLGFSRQSTADSIADIISFAINSCEKQLQESARTKEWYGKELRMFPVEYNLEEGQTGHGGTCFVIYPSDVLLDYAEACSPGAKEFYNKKLKNIGHHPGALGYARLSESNEILVIDNLQTDLDSQKLGSEDPNAIWWASTIKKMWLPTLLDALKQFGNKIGRQIYLTSFQMQQEKWGKIPERNKDVYDRIPEMMGFKTENAKAKPESLPSQTYEMKRIAQESKRFLKQVLFNKIS